MARSPMVRRAFALLCLAGSAAASTAADNPIDKVISMLEGLQKQVAEEGEKEAETYNTFACFCKDATAEKTAAIEAGKDAVSTLTSAIEALSKDRTDLDTKIAGLEADIDAAQKAVSAATAQRAAELAEFETNAADLTAGLSSLRGAIEVLKSSKVSLVQLSAVKQTLGTALLMADALGLAGASAKQAVALLQQPEVQTENYDFKSGGIIKSLESLLSSFEKTKANIDAEEVKAIADHDAFLQEKADLLKQKTAQVEEANKSKAQKQSEIATNTQRLTTVSATLQDDQQYLGELSDQCHNQAVTWDARSKARQDELSALTSAIGIITTTVKAKAGGAALLAARKSMGMRMAEIVATNPAAMEAVEAEAEAVDARVRASPSFLQRRLQVRRISPAVDAGRDAVVTLLRSEGAQLKSTVLTALASRISADPLAKVKVLIQELIERLLQEATNEANQKGWCDKSIADAEQKRNYAAEAIERLNGEMAQLEATRDTLIEEISVLSREIAELTARKEEAEKLRAEEKAENEHTISEAKEGLEAIQEAISVLSKLFKSLANPKPAFIQQAPLAGAPPAPAAAGEAYTGSQGAASGILGMMDVIESDFKRTIETTEKAEAQAEQDHLAFLTETGKSIAAKTAAEEVKTRQKDDALEELAAASDSLSSQSEILDSAIKELLELQPACVNTGMSYEERVARRKDEMAALKKALCILANFGPGGAQGEC